MLRNSRILVIASKAKQSGILDLVLEILDFLGVKGCLFFGILEFLEIASVALLSRNDIGLGILDLCCPLNLAVAASYKTPFLDTVLWLGLGF